MLSLDPRVNRLPSTGITGELPARHALDQLGTYEVFVKPKEDKPFQHEGAVHAPDLEMAFVLAKETFTRRFTCVSLCVAETRDVTASPLSEGEISVYDLIPSQTGDQPALSQDQSFEIYHLQKRGKQMIHAGTVTAGSPVSALLNAKKFINTGKVVYSVWAIPSSAFKFTTREETDLWNTLPDKKFRDASDYKGGDRLKNFIETRNFRPA